MRSKRGFFVRPDVKVHDLRLQASAGPSDVFVLELDGVLVDAFREVCISGLHVFVIC